MLEYLAHREQARLWRRGFKFLKAYCYHPDPAYYYQTEGYQYWEEGKCRALFVTQNDNGTRHAAVLPDGRLAIKSGPTTPDDDWIGALTGYPIRCNFGDYDDLYILTEHHDICVFTRRYAGARAPQNIPSYYRARNIPNWLRACVIGPLPKCFDVFARQLSGKGLVELLRTEDKRRTHAWEWSLDLVSLMSALSRVLIEYENRRGFVQQRDKLKPPPIPRDECWNECFHPRQQPRSATVRAFPRVARGRHH